MADEVHKNKELSRLIQRAISKRTPDIAKYLETQEQRFFNSIIIGIYGGEPAWQELIIDKADLELTEEEGEYLDKTFGVLRLSGSEKMFAIDGQHRTAAIKLAVVSSPELEREEVPVIFVAHRETKEGEVRTRRLFSTLNRYAKPVSKSEIIALDEEDNAAILSRRLIEDFPRFAKKIAIIKGKSLSPTNKTDFTNIVLIYEIIITLLTTKVFIPTISVEGYKIKEFTTRRESDDMILANFEKLKNKLNYIIDNLPFLKEFFRTGIVNRKVSTSNLLFRPIGQIIFFNTYRIAECNDKGQEVLDYFANDTFNIEHPVWRKIFFNIATRTLITTQEVQRAAILLLLDKFDISYVATPKDKAFLDNLQIDVSEID